ncbi:hypothetical protein GCM10009603_15750 [Nocardiopsis exhalans]
MVASSSPLPEQPATTTAAATAAIHRILKVLSNQDPYWKMNRAQLAGPGEQTDTAG